MTLALGALYTANAATYYAGIETIPASLAGVLVYIYPVFVAVLSLRFATALPGRRPWFALVLAVTGIVLALGGVEVGTHLPVSGVAVDPRVRGHLLGLDRPVGAPVRGATRPARHRRATGRLGRPGRRRHDGRDDDRDRGGVRGAWRVGAGAPLDPRTIPTAAWPYLVGIGLIASFLAIQALYAGARRIGAAQAALVSTVEPVFIVVLSFVFLDQRLAPIQLLGAGLMLARGDHRPDLAATEGRARSRRRRWRPRSRAELARRAGPAVGRPASRSTVRAPSAMNAPSDPRPMNRKPSSRCRRQRGRVAQQDAGRLAGAVGGRDDALERVEVARIVEPARDAEAVRQVGRADEQDVDAVDGGDLGGLVDRARRLDLDDAEDARIDDPDVRVAELAEPGAAVDSATPRVPSGG